MSPTSSVVNIKIFKGKWTKKKPRPKTVSPTVSQQSQIQEIPNETGTTGKKKENQEPYHRCQITFDAVQLWSVKSILKGTTIPQQRIAGVTCACIRWNVHRTRRVCVRRGGASRRCSVGGNVYQPVSCMKLPGRRYIATEREMVRRDQRGVTAAAGRGANGPWCADDGRFVATT